MQKQCIVQFSRSKESSLIDSHTRKPKMVEGKEHTRWAWNVPTVQGKYLLFKESETENAY